MTSQEVYVSEVAAQTEASSSSSWPVKTSADRKQAPAAAGDFFSFLFYFFCNKLIASAGGASSPVSAPSCFWVEVYSMGERDFFTHLFLKCSFFSCFLTVLDFCQVHFFAVMFLMFEDLSRVVPRTEEKTTKPRNDPQTMRLHQIVRTR